MRICELVQIACFTPLLAVPVHAQQIDSKDLLRQSAVPNAPPQVPEKAENPKGCEKQAVGFADGVTLTKDNVPRKMKVELVKINETKLIEGSEIMATAKLQNVGAQSIEIPWSTDFRTTQDGQDPDNRSWEVGLFQISLRNKANQYNELMGMSQPLYSSKFVKGSTLTINPGEWITAQISFKVAVHDPPYEKLEEGSADLALEWFQSVRSLVVKDCGVMLGYFPYDGFYERKNRVVVRRVEIRLAANAQKSSQ